MAPKRDKKKEEEANKAATFTEVEKEFLVLQIADLNRKVARLRTALEEYEIRNEELQKAYDQLDEDRADIIAYLKKTLTLKTEENSELKEKVKGLEETREIETAQFKETVTELEKNFITMKDQLTSENKLLAGKLNTLEEFRAVRDDLMRKFETQEQDFKDQETKYKTIIYEAEKKFTIDKDNLKKEMEARLLQLAQDFQDATELRIAASTHRLIRENIAINNELDKILANQAKLSDINEKYKESERESRVALEITEEERDKAMNKNIVQLKVIDKLTATLNDIKKERALHQKKLHEFETMQSKIQEMSKINEDLLSQVRNLEQTLNTKLNDQNKTFAETSKIITENNTLKKILLEAANAVRASLKLDEWAPVMLAQDVPDRQVLLSSLLNIVTQHREIQLIESKDTAAPPKSVYKEGDLGFVPKAKIKRETASSTVLSGVPKESFKQKEKIGTTSSMIINLSPKTKSSLVHEQYASDQELVDEERHLTPLAITQAGETYVAEVDEDTDTPLGKEKQLIASKADILSVVKESKSVRIVESTDEKSREGEIVEKEKEEKKDQDEKVGEADEGAKTEKGEKEAKERETREESRIEDDFDFSEDNQEVKEREQKEGKKIKQQIKVEMGEEIDEEQKIDEELE